VPLTKTTSFISLHDCFVCSAVTWRVTSGVKDASCGAALTSANKEEARRSRSFIVVIDDQDVGEDEDEDERI
jgi:hypothetical protein